MGRRAARELFALRYISFVNLISKSLLYLNETTTISFFLHTRFLRYTFSSRKAFEVNTIERKVLIYTTTNMKKEDTSPMKKQYIACTNTLMNCLNDQDLKALRDMYELRLAKARQAEKQRRAQEQQESHGERQRLLQAACDALAIEQARRSHTAPAQRGA
jgi:hypothetical protein